MTLTALTIAAGVLVLVLLVGIYLLKFMFWSVKKVIKLAFFLLVVIGALAVIKLAFFG